MARATRDNTDKSFDYVNSELTYQRENYRVRVFQGRTSAGAFPLGLKSR